MVRRVKGLVTESHNQSVTSSTHTVAGGHDSCTLSPTHTCTHTHSYTCMHAHARTHTHTHARTNAHTRTHTHAHIHTPWHVLASTTCPHIIKCLKFLLLVFVF